MRNVNECIFLVCMPLMLNHSLQGHDEVTCVTVEMVALAVRVFVRVGLLMLKVITFIVMTGRVMTGAAWNSVFKKDWCRMQLSSQDWG